MYNVALIGGNNRVILEILEILEKNDLNQGDIHILDFKSHHDNEDIECELDSSTSGQRLLFNGEYLSIKNAKEFDYSLVDFVIYCDSSLHIDFIMKKAGEESFVVIDNSGSFLDDPQVPVIIPEINADKLVDYKNKMVVANPNCTAVIMMIPLYLLHAKFGVKRVVCSTYQAVSGAGNAGLEELFNQTKGIFSQQAPTNTQKTFSKQISFNVIPRINDFIEDGDTKEEWSLYFQTKRVLDPSIAVTATCVRVPVFIGHGMSLNIELMSDFTEDEIRSVLNNEEKAVSVIDHRAPEGYVTPVETAGEDKIYISRIRKDKTQANTINMWVVSDNLRRGSAMNLLNILHNLYELRNNDIVL